MAFLPYDALVVLERIAKTNGGGVARATIPNDAFTLLRSRKLIFRKPGNQPFSPGVTGDSLYIHTAKGWRLLRRLEGPDRGGTE